MTVQRAAVTSSCIALALLVSCAPKPVSPLKLLGVWHDVEAGDTVDSVAERYGADPVILAELNDLPRSGELDGRERVFVPKSGGKPPGIGADPPAPYQGPITHEAPAKSGAGAGKTGSCSGKTCLAWPVDGKLSSRFGSRGGKQHDGIDIVAPKGTPVKAAAAGVVIYSGAEIKGYGNLVLIRHEDGMITVYAHNDENLVAEGDEVTRGQKVAEVGRTGSATADHLHFEVRVDERPRDPLLHLSPKEGSK